MAQDQTRFNPMQPTSLWDLYSHPSFLTLLITFLAVIFNILVGVTMLPKDARKKYYNLHRYGYWTVLLGFAAFLIVTHELQGDYWFNYFVFLYFLAVVPQTRKINVTLHAVLASVGLALLGVVAGISL